MNMTFAPDGSLEDRRQQAGGWLRLAHQQACDGHLEAALASVSNAELVAGHEYEAVRGLLVRITALTALER